jgi:predicted  nucleic acid-binding Zn-ribbon protein
MNRILLTAALAISLMPYARAQSYTGFEDVRAVVSRTQSDLSRAGDLANKEKERERIVNAQRRLSDFDKHISRGKFHKDALDDAIKDVQNVLDHNTLSPGDRDALKEDVQQMRVIREKRGAI